MKETVLCFMKKGFPHVEAYLKKNFDARIIKDDQAYVFCKACEDDEVDYIISFLSPWILPKEILQRALKKAINFHPAPPKYPGSAGYNLAIYNQDGYYGCTCHEMVEKVDSGQILDTYEFRLRGNETVLELRHRSHVVLEELFYWVMNHLEETITSLTCAKWECEPHTFKELEQLCDCTGITDPEELELRIRACYFPGAKHYPFIRIGKKKYKLEEVKKIDRINHFNVEFDNSSRDTIAWTTGPYDAAWYGGCREEECESNGSDDRAD